MAQKNPPNHHGRRKPAKKTVQKVRNEKKTPNRKEARDLGSMRRGYKRTIKVLFSIEKSGLSHDR
jgi:hypothetical protein